MVERVQSLVLLEDAHPEGRKGMRPRPGESLEKGLETYPCLQETESRGGPKWMRSHPRIDVGSKTGITGTVRVGAMSDTRVIGTTQHWPNSSTDVCQQGRALPGSRGSLHCCLARSARERGLQTLDRA